mmetsp:Transcript_22302/g.47804  ORF Transcript_22302/g.47804 Transcript_22302/m.47804 type:complete len:328 (+) Transcript_22302:13-996(+)
MALTEAEEAFLTFDWTNEGWQKYFNELYPQPNHAQAMKFKKKWYRANIDSSLDANFDPLEADRARREASETKSKKTDGGPGLSSSEAFANVAPAAVSSLSRPMKRMSLLLHLVSVICGFCYLPFGADLYFKALQAFCFGFVVELYGKYGRPRLQVAWWRPILLDDAFCSLILTMMFLPARPLVFVLAMPTLSSVLFCGEAVKSDEAVLPAALGFLKQRLLACVEPKRKQTVLQLRSDIEVGVVFLLITMALLSQGNVVLPLIFLNFMRIRYLVNPFTQASFKKVDSRVSPMFEKIPGVGWVWNKFKGFLYSCVDKDKLTKTPKCSIL